MSWRSVCNEKLSDRQSLGKDPRFEWHPQKTAGNFYQNWPWANLTLHCPKNCWFIFPQMAPLGSIPCHRLPKRTFAADSVRPCGPCQDGPTGSPNIWVKTAWFDQKWPKGSKPRESPGLSHQHRDLWM